MIESDDAPSDTSAFIVDVFPPSSNDSPEIEKIKNQLNLIAALTNRGQLATSKDRTEANELVYQLEALNSNTDTTGDIIHGNWELLYSDVELFRCSPFYMTVRSILGDDDEKASRFFSRLVSPGAEIGKVRQIIDNDSIVGEIDLKIGRAPFQITGTVVSSGSLSKVSNQGFEVTVKDAAVTNSNVFPLLNGLSLPVDSILQRFSGSSQSVVLNTFYIDRSFRVSRTVDEHFYVFIRK